MIPVILLDLDQDQEQDLGQGHEAGVEAEMDEVKKKIFFSQR